MKLHYGAANNLKNLIKTHLFIICSPHSGTTFLKNALSTSKNTWNLPKEGQHTYGFAGPSSNGLKAQKLWATEKWIDTFSTSQNYDWERIKKAWNFQAFSLNPEATVFVEKSPPFLLIINQLIKEFENARFLFMVRNPYAVVEGIRRRIIQYKLHDNIPAKELLTQASIQVINCLKIQKQNLETWGDHGVFFTYEQMCEEPERVQEKIIKLVPEIDDLVLRQKLRIKDYNEELRNMNEQQIERLTNEDIEQINEVFAPYEYILEYFNYSLLNTLKI